MNINILKETPFFITVKDMNCVESSDNCECCDCCDCNIPKKCENIVTKQKQLFKKENETQQFAKWYFILKLKK